MNLKKAVRVGLALKGKSQENLAKHLERSPVTVSNYMTGKANPPFSVVCAMAEFFDVSMSIFCSWGETISK